MIYFAELITFKNINNNNKKKNLLCSSFNLIFFCVNMHIMDIVLVYKIFQTKQSKHLYSYIKYLLIYIHFVTSKRDQSSTIYLKAHSLLIWIRLIRDLKLTISNSFVLKEKKYKRIKPQHRITQHNKSHACDYAIIITG